MNFKRKSRRRLFLLMRSRTPPISSEFRGGLNTPNPPSRYATGELHHIIAEVSKTTIHEAVIENLGYRKLCARWVPKMLTITKLKRMGSELKFLTRYAQEGDEFLDSIVTGDETRGFHHTPESKQRLLQWRHTYSLRWGARKVMTWFRGLAANFCDSGIQKLVPRLYKCLDNAGDYVEKWSYVQTIHSQYRCCIFTFVSILSGHASYNCKYPA